MPVHIVGMESSSEFYATHMGGTRTTLDVDLQKKELVEIAQECRNTITQIPEHSYWSVPSCLHSAADIQDVVNLPVFDYIGFIDMIHCAVVQRRYTGIL